MVQEGEGGSSRRAPITTGSSLETFYMNYVYNTNTYDGANPYTNSYSAGKWTSSGFWPIPEQEEETVYWYAYSYHEGGKQEFHLDGSNKPYINFSVEESTTSQHDLLVAKTSGTYNDTYISGTNKLAFTFDHVCSALHFHVKKSSNISTHTLNITKIVLHNVVKQANYKYDTSSWTLSGSKTDYTLYEGSAVTLTSSYIELLGNEGTPYGTKTDPYLFLIPQTLTAWDPSGALSNAYLEVQCTIDGGSSQTAYIPFSATFAQGTKHDIFIRIGKNSLYSYSDVNKKGSLIIP